jgi:putative FmdB family regulatory protein
MTYVFKCGSCHHEFEVTATVAEYQSRGAPACPRCGRSGARRVFTPVLVMSAAGRDSAPSSGGCGCGGACSCGH